MTSHRDPPLPSGDRSTLTGGHYSTLTGGNRSTLTGGDCSTLTGGNRSTLTAGDHSTLTAGDHSTLTGGYRSTITGGYGSVLICRYYCGGWKVAVAVVDGDTIKAGVAYRHNVERGVWEEVKCLESEHFDDNVVAEGGYVGGEVKP